MSRSWCVSMWCSVCAVFGFGFAAFAQPLVVNGVTDRSDNNVNSASFSVPVDPGHSYLVLLDGQRVPAGATNLVVGPDYHEISVWRTNASTGEVTNRLVRFVIMSDRGDPERGLIPWVAYPQIPSANAEVAGATLQLMVPADYPLGLEIPVIARVENASGHARRVNGLVTADNFPSFRILRGHGSGFLPAATEATPTEYSAEIGGVGTYKEINIESSTAWTTVSGTLAGNVVWPDNSRIHVNANLTIPSTSTLTIGAGTVIKLNPLVNITNSGRTVINGTTERPVVFTSTNRVLPEVRTHAWGGFFLRNAAAQLVANGAIFVGGGGAASISFSPGASHRSEQAVFLVHSGARLYLTNCAVINTAGQIGNGYNSDVTYDHCLIQKAITTGEYVGGTIIVNHSALIEFPEDNGTVNSSIANADYDAIYFTTGTHLIYNSLIGFCKDDAIDSGSGGGGTVLLTNCWIESALHEANAWSNDSGLRLAETFDSVLINSGQGFECGWSGPVGSPSCYMSNSLSIGNSVGVRFGDNYESIGPFNGQLRVTNSYVLYNYRDVWGMTWRNDSTGWFYRSNQMHIGNNFLSQPNPFHPNNTTWDGNQHGWRLARFMTTPPDAPIGIGFAAWTTNLPISTIFAGVPVRLSSFTTNTVQVDYAFQAGSQPEVPGTITFQPGEILKHIFPYGFNVSSYPNPRLILANPVGGQLTGDTNVQFQGTASSGVIRPVFDFKSQHDHARLQEGHPLARSAPSGLPETAAYQYRSAAGILSTGLVTFAPGETLAWADPPEVDVSGIDVVQLDFSYQPVPPAIHTAYFLKLPPRGALPQPITLIARGSAWRYPNVAGQLNAIWRTSAYNDSAWLSGPSEIGFGDGDEAREITEFDNQITYYFRRPFTVADPDAFGDLSLWMRRDDGAVMYLNGTEVFRSSSMPAFPTTITFTTEAVNEGENAEQSATLSPAALIAGQNLIAVEVHQDDPGSSDISFNMELIGNPLPAPPPVYIFRYGPQLLVAWTEPSFVLQQADAIGGAWTPVNPNTSPFVIQVDPDVPQKFYRLRR